MESFSPNAINGVRYGYVRKTFTVLKRLAADIVNATRDIDKQANKPSDITFKRFLSALAQDKAYKKTPKGKALAAAVPVQIREAART